MSAVVSAGFSGQMVQKRNSLQRGAQSIRLKDSTWATGREEKGGGEE